MNKPSIRCCPHRFISFLIALIAPAFCLTATAQQPPSADIDNKAITNIEFRLAEDNLEQFGFSLPKMKISDRVINNLSEWHYPIHSDSARPYTHRLQVRVGPISHDKTPVGFSFSAGNSDPRAPGFQKAEVLAITCHLSAQNRRQKPIENTMEFSARPFIEAAKNRSKQAGAIDLLADRISTVCFNLLKESELERESKPGRRSQTQPGWMPEITIEVSEKPAGGNNPSEKEAGRKEITIHNQGTPVILKLGHDRL
ncbi:MAG: hypothetical protein ACU83O_03210 [Gammaproteobacteria bacterium]